MGYFVPYNYPKPNMLVQEGTRVEIHGLLSEAGKKLNGKMGTALEFLPDKEGRWVVLLDGDDGKKAIRIENLVYHSSTSTGKSCREEFLLFIITKDHANWTESSQGGRILVSAGESVEGPNNKTTPAICIYDNPSSPDFDRERFHRAISTMGVVKDTKCFAGLFQARHQGGR